MFGCVAMKNQQLGFSVFLVVPPAKVQAADLKLRLIKCA